MQERGIPSFEIHVYRNEHYFFSFPRVSESYVLLVSFTIGYSVPEIGILLANCHLTITPFSQALFRKIAAALPGMETLSSTKQEDMVDVNLKSSNPNASVSQQQSGGCSC